MEQFQLYYPAAAENLNYFISAARDGHDESLDQTFGTDGLDDLAAAINTDTQIKDLQYAQWLLTKHAKGMREPVDVKPCDLIDHEFGKTLALMRHKDNIISIVSLLTPDSLDTIQPLIGNADEITQTMVPKQGKIIALNRSTRIPFTSAHTMR